MTEKVCKALARARSGFVEAPAGCGKTETIVHTVGRFCDGCQLVLTHTHAGVDALRQRFRHHSIKQSKYHIDTIAGWAWGWVRMYPGNSLKAKKFDNKKTRAASFFLFALASNCTMSL
jgi:hypothetical protein